jgi:hypothetical protein
MSRVSDYGIDDLDSLLAAGRWMAAAKMAIRGKRGKKALTEIRDMMLAMPQKRLAYHNVAEADGTCCIVGAYVMKQRVEAGEDPAAVLADLIQRNDEGEFDDSNGGGTASLGEDYGLTYTLAWELMYRNDEVAAYNATPEQRYTTVLGCINRMLAQPPITRKKKRGQATAQTP